MAREPGEPGGKKLALHNLRGAASRDMLFQR
jgi:hypothetical protein